MSDKPNGILAMNPEKYREIDGVVFDLASYARHCKSPAAKQLEPPAPPTAPEQSSQPPEDSVASAQQQDTSPMPAPVFPVDPYPVGWYPAEADQPPIPIMGGALEPVEIEEHFAVQGVIKTIIRRFMGSGSGSGSYVTSYITSYRTSYVSSGSGSYRFGSDVYWVGGYGLELI